MLSTRMSPRRKNKNPKEGKQQSIGLSTRLEGLSRKRQELIRPALEHAREFVLLSIRASAERLKTDPATMVRIVRGMGFAAYRDFQHYLQELSIAHATSMDMMAASSARGSSIPAQIQASLEQDLKNLEAFTRTLDADRVMRLTRRIYSSKRILLIGGDLAANLVKFLEHHLMILGLPASCAITHAEVVHKIRHLGKKDLVIAISFRRGLRQTVEGLREAMQKEVYTVGVTDSAVSPICEFANECFFLSVDAPSFGASYVAPIALLNAIVVACANYRRSRTMSLIKKVEEEQRHGFRWYDQ
jgi:RpiR family carbohydrate utilization transcriptional regulator